jgi:hypothetical protein
MVRTMNNPNPVAVHRRELLRFLSVGAGAVAVCAGALPTDAEADTETDSEKRKSRYRETDHVKAFYRVNRYPG